uniref:Uncharacterized protein n=1 Tax=Leersia perrieri TaxID=77586 RepID=A0A0D9WRI8_9ORYZ
MNKLTACLNRTTSVKTSNRENLHPPPKSLHFSDSHWRKARRKKSLAGLARAHKIPGGYEETTRNSMETRRDGIQMRGRSAPGGAVEGPRKKSARGVAGRRSIPPRRRSEDWTASLGYLA